MNKIVKIITTLLFLALSTRAALAAAGDLSVKISTPKSPTNQNTFNVGFVALDLLNRPVAVKCFKKAPADATFSQFGSDFNLIAGGSSDNCAVNTSVINGEGTYQFYVNATAGGDSLDSSVVTVDYKTSGPGTPTDYSKEQTAPCSFKLKFRTADDGGKTVKVEFYRSDQQSFTTGPGSEFATLILGSNVASELNTTVPDCGKTWYFALRAFDNAGNGSGLVGDTITTTITTTTQTTSTTTVGPTPIIVVQSQVGAAETETTPAETELVSPTPTEEVATTPQVEGAATTDWAGYLKRYLPILLILIAFVYVLKRRYDSA